MLTEAIRKSDALVEALPYIKQFRDQIVVIKLGGSAQEDETVLRHIFADIDFMLQVGMKPVVVHGGGKEITRALAQSGLPTRFVNGHRYTDAATLAIVARVLMDEVNTHLLALMRDIGGKAAPLNGRDHHFLKALKRNYHGGEDLGFVGEPVAINAALVFEILARGEAPVIAPIAHGLGDDRETLYNINGDTASALIARELRAEKLVFFMDIDGIRADRDNPQSLISHATQALITEMKNTGAINAGMIPKTEAALFALAGGVKKVHIVSGGLPHALLLEIFTRQGVGTEIVL
ncbi:MAG: acetylglutamate kinase [Planctomycetota bacterium]|jgi:acetylglutamate kinase|nr:acetylglutamate kinase [Planctomycetota bacterium]